MFDPVAHIHQCENEWRKVGYQDERVWPHMFPNTLDDIAHKWYKIEEACGHTFNWNEIKHNFIKDFEFIPKEALLQEATKEIKIFLGKPNPDEIQKGDKAKVNIISTLTCNFLSTQSQDNIKAHQIDMENISFQGKSF